MFERYARQLALAEIGASGQRKLEAASVLVVGAGGLGCAVLPYLCGAGVGHVVIVDHDRVDETNLHRQPLYRMSDLGKPKAIAAQRTLRELNPHVRVEAICERLTPANCASLVADAHVVIDAADSFAVTYTLNDVCKALGRPFVSASVTGLAGYVGAFCVGAPSYRAVFPDMPSRAGTCAETGVLGTAVAVVGSLQAHVVLALILELQPSALGRLTTIDLGTLRFGGFTFGAASEPSEFVPFIAESQIGLEDCVIDVRSAEEATAAPIRSTLRSDTHELERIIGAARQRRIVLCCRSGVRAWRAASRLRSFGHEQLALVALGR